MNSKLHQSQLVQLTTVKLCGKPNIAERAVFAFVNKIFFEVTPCQGRVLDGFDLHFQATVHHPLDSAVD